VVAEKNENNDSRYGKTNNRNCSINLLFGINSAINNVINRMGTASANMYKNMYAAV